MCSKIPLQLLPDLGQIFINDFGPLYILADFVMLWMTFVIAVDYIGCELQLALPNARTTLRKKIVILLNTGCPINRVLVSRVNYPVHGSAI